MFPELAEAYEKLIEDGVESGLAYAGARTISFALENRQHLVHGDVHKDPLSKIYLFETKRIVRDNC